MTLSTDAWEAMVRTATAPEVWLLLLPPAALVPVMAVHAAIRARLRHLRARARATDLLDAADLGEQGRPTARPLYAEFIDLYYVATFTTGAYVARSLLEARGALEWLPETLHALPDNLLIFAAITAVVKAVVLLVTRVAMRRMEVQADRILHLLFMGAYYLLALVLFLGFVFDAHPYAVLAPALLFAGIAGIGLKDLLANLFMSLYISFEPSINRGDWISLQGHDGRIVDIQMNHIKLMTLDREIILIPIRQVIGATVVNHTHHYARLGAETTCEGRHHAGQTLAFGVDYGSDPERVRQVAGEVVAAHPNVCGRPTPTVRFVDYAAYSLQFRVTYFIDDYRRHRQVTSDLHYALWTAFQQAGIRVPFPIVETRGGDGSGIVAAATTQELSP